MNPADVFVYSPAIVNESLFEFCSKRGLVVLIEPRRSRIRGSVYWVADVYKRGGGSITTTSLGIGDSPWAAACDLARELAGKKVYEFRVFGVDKQYGTLWASGVGIDEAEFPKPPFEVTDGNL